VKLTNKAKVAALVSRTKDAEHAMAGDLLEWHSFEFSSFIPSVLSEISNFEMMYAKSPAVPPMALIGLASLLRGHTVRGPQAPDEHGREVGGQVGGAQGSAAGETNTSQGRRHHGVQGVQ
jgi:hypothetical protein